MERSGDWFVAGTFWIWEFSRLFINEIVARMVAHKLWRGVASVKIICFLMDCGKRELKALHEQRLAQDWRALEKQRWDFGGRFQEHETHQSYVVNVRLNPL